MSHVHTWFGAVATSDGVAFTAWLDACWLAADDAVDALVRGPRFHTVALEADLLDLALRVGRRARLRAYDAVYGALALSRGEALYTLDLDLEQHLADAFPEVPVVTRA